MADDRSRGNQPFVGPAAPKVGMSGAQNAMNGADGGSDGEAAGGPNPGRAHTTGHANAPPGTQPSPGRNARWGMQRLEPVLERRYAASAAGCPPVQMICSRPAPTPTSTIGTPTQSAMNRR